MKVSDPFSEKCNGCDENYHHSLMTRVDGEYYECPGCNAEALAEYEADEKRTKRDEEARGL